MSLRCYEIAAAAVALSSASVAHADALEDGFYNPPASARPHVWYHMMNGNATKEGVTRDFEALAEVGIGGVQMFDAGCSIPAGPIKFNSPEWFGLMRHSMTEARRLGLEVCLPNCSGWSSSGGPWVAASNAMKRVFLTSTHVRGGETFDGKLPKPESPCGFYEDIACLAVAIPPSCLDEFQPSVDTGKDGVVTAMLPSCEVVAGCFYAIKFPEIWKVVAEIDVDVTRDGVAWEPLERRKLTLSVSGRGNHGRRFLAFDAPEKIRGVRMRAKCFGSGSPLPSSQARVVDLMPTCAMSIPQLEEKTFVFRGESETCHAVSTPDQVVQKDHIVDLTDKMLPDGSLVWRAPEGCTWDILRIGYSALDVCNHPASEFGRGLEVDKFSAAALSDHFDSYIGRLCRFLGPLAGGETGLNNILVDSYEVGCQNWTRGFDEEFRRRKGYDICRYMPVFAGYVVGGMDETERFLWDFRRVCADLFAENYGDALAKKCHEHGLKLSVEPYGSGPFDNLQYGHAADIPMGEFWSKSRQPGYCGEAGNSKFAAYVGHVWGRKVIAAESFTANPKDSGAWLTTPELIKPICDAAYAGGVNRIIYHRFVHQPWADDRLVPGLTMGQWGMHFDRHNTWWPYAREFVRYQTRCQFLLQQGSPVADVLFWCGEDAPNQGGNTDGVDSSRLRLPFGYDWDVCDTTALCLLTVRDGCLIAPGGTAYRVLVLPPSRTMSPDILAKIEALVGAGAKVAGPVCPSVAPGLSGYPCSDADVARRAEALWGSGVIKADASTALRALGIEPDVAVVSAACAPKWTHRRMADSDIYFVCRNNTEKESLVCSFRVNGRMPEIWDAESGRISAPVAWSRSGNRTVVSLELETCGSAFVVFRDVPSKSLNPADAAVVVSEQTVDGPWDVSFSAKYDGVPKQRRFDRLASWTESDDPDLKYLSGDGTYVKSFQVTAPRSGELMILDLGEVKNFAEVTVNGRKFAPLWKPPYRVDITPAVPSTGFLNLSIKVTNLWPNRLIGDDALPADVEWKDPDGLYQPIKEIPQWAKEGRKSPTGRHTFTTWRFWNKGDSLLPSGLLGPVKVLTTAAASSVSGLEEK